MIRAVAFAPLLILLAACADRQPLPPIAPPAPPPIVKVPMLVPLPAGMTDPCQKPAKRPIATDVDLLTAADAFKVWGECNAAKLQAIGQAQPQ